MRAICPFLYIYFIIFFITIIKKKKKKKQPPSAREGLAKLVLDCVLANQLDSFTEAIGSNFIYSLRGRVSV